MEDFSDILIVTDLDGTFFSKNPTGVVPRNMKAIDWFKERGGLFTLATGRMHCNMAKPLPMAKELLNAPMIACNGALLYDIRTGETVAENLMDQKAGMEVLKFTLEHYPEMGIRLTAPEGFVTTPYMSEHNRYIRKDIDGSNLGGYRLAELKDWSSFRWYKFVFRDEPANIESLRAILEPEYRDIISFSMSGPKFFEAQGKNVSKALLIPVLRDYCEKKTGKKTTVICCGDYENDIEMLRAADISVCPENALDEVKAVSTMCLCHCNDGLIADVIEYAARQKGIDVKF